MGIIGSPTAELVFTNAPCQLVGERRLGLIKYTMSLMNGARLGVGAQAVGLCEAACREAVAYAAAREQFGKTIDQMVPVQDLLHTMRAKTDAVRSLLYETARQVDLANCYDRLSKVRPLTAEERQAMKAALRNADCLTPLTKLMASEYSNQNAYDCIQVHGGSGFMLEYACQRIYRDARITSIYEGTTQLQTVAAIRYVTNGFYSQVIESLTPSLSESEEDNMFSPFKGEIERVLRMADKFNACTAAVKEADNQELHDLCARHLYEMAADVIMCLLLMQNAAKAPELFAKSLQVYVNLAEAEVEKHYKWLQGMSVDQLDNYRKA